MKLRGRVDAARTVCEEHGIDSRSPLAVVAGDEDLYCEYKLLLYTKELEGLLFLYSTTKDVSLIHQVKDYVDRSVGLCDLMVNRGQPVEGFYSLLDRCMDVVEDVIKSH